MVSTCACLTKKKFAVILLAVLMMGCRSAQPPITIRETNVEVSEIKKMVMPSDTSDNVYTGLNRREWVLQFYQLVDHQPRWVENEKPSAQVDSMLLFIERIRYYGLLRANYHASEIEVRKNAVRNQHNLTRLDAILTDSFLAIAHDLKYGRLNAAREVGEDSLCIALLQQAFIKNNVTKELMLQEPSFEGYHLLKKALKMLLDTLDDSNKSALMKGYSYKTIAQQDQIQCIEVNLERWRGERKSFGKHYLFVNIPSYSLDVIVNRSIVLQSKVIVGRPESPTPTLSSVIECFVIYPYWNVPRKISIEEYLPLIQNDTSFLNRNNFDVLSRKGKLLRADSVPWNKFSQNYFPVSLRQREGSDNSLGVLKFVFDNPYAVYLHDTNAKYLFQSDQRAFSHGCIRMEKAIELAHYLVTGSVSRKSFSIDDHLNRKERYTMSLPNPIPIHVRYFTCEFRNDVYYQYADIYDLDKKLIDQLYKY